MTGSVEIITIADELFGQMMRVALASLYAQGDVPQNAQMAVYDFGLGLETRGWCAKHGIEVRSPGECPDRQLLPVHLSDKQRRFDLWVCKTWAIKDAAERVGPDGIVIFFDADMAALEPVVGQLIGFAREGDSRIMACFDPMTTTATLRSWDLPAYKDETAFWKKHFGADWLGNRATWNIGLLAATGQAILDFQPAWQQANLAWPTRAADFKMPCYDQLMFAVVAHQTDQKPMPIPSEYNVTRPAWNDRAQAATAKIIHLTGPIKPWQPGGQTHPMTALWMKVARDLHAKGYET